MTSRRRNLFVILLMLGLLAASGVVIATKQTRLGLDLKGGVELVYQGEPTPQSEVTPEAIDRAIDIIRERVDQLGVSEPEIQRLGSDQISVGLPGVKNLDRAKKQVGTTAQLYFYDWEKNVIGDPRTPITEPLRGGQEGVEAEAGRGRQQHDQGRSTTCSSPTRRSPQGPDATRKDLLSQFDGRVPQGHESCTVPPGHGRRARREARQLPERPGRSTSFFVLRDNPELKGTDLKNPEAELRPARRNEPIVTFEFTGKGRKAFHDVTKRLAQRGQTEQIPGQPVESSFQTFAIVLDREIVSRPFIDYRENPDGIDGRTGAQISGGFTLQSAQDLADVLKTGALPITLKLISQTQVSATLGKQALHQGLIAGVVGFVVVLLFLLLFYRLLGAIAGRRALHLRDPLLRADQADPDHADAARHRGTDPHDRRRGGLEHRHLRAHQGRVTRRQVDDGGDLHGLLARHHDDHRRERRHADHGVHPVHARDGGRQGLRLHARCRHARLAVHGRALHPGGARHDGPLAAASQPGDARRRRAAPQLELRLHGHAASTSSRCRASSSLIGSIALATKELNFGIDFESGTRVTASLDRPASVEEVRSAISPLGLSDAKIQQVKNKELGPNVVQISTTELGPGGVKKLEDTPRTRTSASTPEGFSSESVGPTFGTTVARSAVIAIIASLLLIMAYVAFRFEPKFAVPVLIALFHDILITAGVYSLTGREVTTSTVAALLTILGFSLYDTVIVFDRVRENAPRMPRAAFSQIVNRSMSEVLTRSLATSFCTLLPVTALLLFGGETLKDFAFALLVGIASGAYSSIFIASPVLTEWKEREPATPRRRHRIEEQFGYVPAFATVTHAGVPEEPGRRRPRMAPRPRRRRAKREARAGAGDRARARGRAEPDEIEQPRRGRGAGAATKRKPAPRAAVRARATGAARKRAVDAVRAERAERKKRARQRCAPQAREKAMRPARLGDDGHRDLALRGIRAGPLLGRHRRRVRRGDRRRDVVGLAARGRRDRRPRAS